MNNNISSPAWLCSKERAIQTAGLKGILRLEAGNLLFQSEDNTKNITITSENLKLADLNNIMGHSQVVFYTNDGNSFVFVFSKPVSTKESLLRLLFYSRFARTITGIRHLSDSIMQSKKWKDTLLNALPEDKVRTRKEIRGWFVIVTSLVVTLAILAVLILVVIILFG